MNKEKLSKVARTLMFEVNNEVLHDLAIEYDFLQQKIRSLKKINVENVLPLIYVDETPLTFLSPDEPETSLDVAKVLKNAPHLDNNYIILPRVIKDA